MLREHLIKPNRESARNRRHSAKTKKAKLKIVAEETTDLDIKTENEDDIPLKELRERNKLETNNEKLYEDLEYLDNCDGDSDIKSEPLDNLNDFKTELTDSEEEQEIKFKKTRIKRLPLPSGPPYECKKCLETFDTHLQLREHR